MRVISGSLLKVSKNKASACLFLFKEVSIVTAQCRLPQRRSHDYALFYFTFHRTSHTLIASCYLLESFPPGPTECVSFVNQPPHSPPVPLSELIARKYYFLLLPFRNCWGVAGLRGTDRTINTTGTTDGSLSLIWEKPSPVQKS